MYSEPGNRHQRRAAASAATKTDRPAPFRGSRAHCDNTTRADEVFHRRFPARTIRMRVASRPEVERMEAQRISVSVR